MPEIAVGHESGDGTKNLDAMHRVRLIGFAHPEQGRSHACRHGGICVHDRVLGPVVNHRGLRT